MANSKDVYKAVAGLVATKNGDFHSGSFCWDVASHLGLANPDSMGAFSSGKAKLPSFVNNALKKLVNEGKLSKVGRGKYRNNNAVGDLFGSEIQADLEKKIAEENALKELKEKVELERADEEYRKKQETLARQQARLDEEKVIKEAEFQKQIEESKSKDFLYDISDEATVNFLASITPCWGKHLAKDIECRKCPLALKCEEAKTLLAQKKKEEKAIEKEKVEALEEVGIEPRTFTIDPSAKMDQAVFIEGIQAECICVASQRSMKVGEKAFFVPSWGVVGEKEGIALGLKA